MSSQGQSWNPEQYRANAAFVAELGKPVLDLLAPSATDRVLDLGCGDGSLTVELARLGCAVVGVDSSENMIEAARGSGVEAHVMDGTNLEFASEFDAVFSNAALHWMKPPEDVLAGVWRALKPGGRFVGEFGGSGNVGTIIRAIEAALEARGHRAVCPWFFPTPEQYSALLRQAGFEVRSTELFTRPTPLPEDMRGWLETFAGSYFAAIEEKEREELVSEIVETLDPQSRDEKGRWVADYVRLRFSAEKIAHAV